VQIIRHRAPPGHQDAIIRALTPGELAFPESNPALPVVVERRRSDVTLLDLIRTQCATLRFLLEQHGAVLFRGFGVTSPDEFEDALAAYGLRASADYPFGVSPRHAVTKRVFKSTEYANFMVIPPHTEMAYLRWRPRWIAFCCDVAPEQFGETPLYDMAAAFAALPAALQQRLSGLEMSYVRHVRHKKAFVTFERTIEETFGTRDRAAIEAFCRAWDIRPAWIGDRMLRAETVLPAVAIHPDTGRRSLNAQFVNAAALIAGIARIAARYPAPLRALFKAYIRFQYRKPTVHYRSRPASGPDFTATEMAAIDRAIQGTSTVFSWRRGDMIVIDNVRAAHGRLNVKGPRRILTALGDMYDVRAPMPVKSGKAA
jgi:alpha-ketoglutarate-dependent taurine dioxygenase